MKLWVVNYTYGDYIGWFENCVVGVYDNEKDAENMSINIKAKHYGKSHHCISIDEVELNKCQDMTGAW